MKHRKGIKKSEDDPIVLTRMLRDGRNWLPGEREAIEKRLDAARVRLGLCPIQRMPTTEERAAAQPTH